MIRCLSDYTELAAKINAGVGPFSLTGSRFSSATPKLPGVSERRDPPVGEEAREQFAARLRSRREELGLSQAQLGQLLQTEHGKPVHRSQISVWEAGKIFPLRRFRPHLAKALRLDEVDLFGDLSANRPDFESRMDTVEARFWALADLLAVSETDIERVVEKRRKDRVTKAAADGAPLDPRGLARRLGVDGDDDEAKQPRRPRRSGSARGARKGPGR